jgi:MoaA/NifB/PqqE/SkfB family radical SAM enzyme
MSTWYDLDQTETLHIELNARCNAACPQCARFSGDAVNPDLAAQGELTVDRLRERLPTHLVKKLKKLLVCGPFSDPAMSNNLKPILKWFRAHNPDIVLGLNTNGSLRTPSWWSDLAKIMDQPLDYVVWSIDGLEDTNHIYRRNTSWQKIMNNSQAFIQAGGRAHWDMLIFDHNQHQVQAAQQLAQQRGFTWFRCKVSNRFQEQPVSWLSPPRGHDPVVSTGAIQCDSLHNRTLYMDSNGTFYPCCFINTTVFSHPPGEMRDQIREWLAFDQEYLDTTLQQIQQHGVWDRISKAWDQEPALVCQRYCKTNACGQTHTHSQWKREIQF